MDLSETIVAAMIGAGATVGTALFQLLTAFRAKSDLKPKRGTTARSLLAVTALMIASAAGGFLYSQFLQQRAGEDLRAVRQELRELRDLTAQRVIEERQHTEARQPSIPRNATVATLAEPPATPVSLEPEGGVVESIAYVPACVTRTATDGSAGCQEAEAQRIALCGTIPAHATVTNIALFAQPDAVQHPWAEHAVALERDLGGARFSGKSFEYAQGQDVKAVCVNFLQWSTQHPHFARIVVEYGLGGSPAPTAEVQMPVMTEASTSPADGLQAVTPTVSAFGGSATALR